MQNLLNKLLMVLVLIARLTFPAAARPDGSTRPAFEVRRVVNVKVESSWRNLTSTATVQVPGRWLFKENRLAIKDWLRHGDRISIELGYNTTLVQEFAGYVTDVKPGVPVTLTCEDEMYRLKRYAVKCSYESVRLPKLLADICPAGTDIDALDTDLGSFKAVNVTVAKVLEKLKEMYGFVSYFRGGKLYCGKVYSQAGLPGKTAFTFQRRGPGVVLEDQLEYRNSDDLKVIVKATSHQLHGKNLTATVGDVNALDAEERTLNYFNLASQADLEARAQARCGQAESDRLQRQLHHLRARLRCSTGGQAALSSTEYPERNGDFFIDATAKTFEKGGYRQEITLGSAASLYGLQG